MPIKAVARLKELALNWTDMQKAVNNVLVELKSKGLKVVSKEDPIKSPSNFQQTVIFSGGSSQAILRVLRDRGFKKDARGTLGKRVGSWAIAVDVGESGMGVDVEFNVTDFDGPKEEDIGPGHDYYGD